MFGTISKMFNLLIPTHLHSQCYAVHGDALPSASPKIDSNFAEVFIHIGSDSVSLSSKKLLFMNTFCNILSMLHVKLSWIVLPHK